MANTKAGGHSALSNGGAKLAWIVVVVLFGVLVTAGGTVIAHAERITRCETQIGSITEQLARIEAKVDTLLGRP